MKHDNELGKVTAGTGSNCQEQYRNPGFWWRGGRPTTESWGIHKPRLPGRPKKLSDEQRLKAAKLFDEAYKQLRTGLTLHFICSSVNEEIGVTVFEIRISHGFGQALWSVKRDSVAFSVGQSSNHLLQLFRCHVAILFLTCRGLSFWDCMLPASARLPQQLSF